MMCAKIFIGFVFPFFPFIYRNDHLINLVGSNPGHFYKRHSIYIFDPESKLQM